jgi:hypothetical protein
MHDDTQAIMVRRRRSRGEAEQLVAEYEASGLNRIEFCRQRGLSLATLARYRRRRAGGAMAGDGWVAVEVSNECPASRSMVGSGLAVALSGGRRIEVSCGFDSSTLVQLLGVLERR